jgi:hypothetical protein
MKITSIKIRNNNEYYYNSIFLIVDDIYNLDQWEHMILINGYYLYIMTERYYKFLNTAL